MLQLGVAGVGHQFPVYRDALRRLRNPVEIDAVYDPVFARAEAVAEREEDVVVETGLRALANRHSVDAILLLDAGWHGRQVLELLAMSGKPVFVAPWLTGTADDFERLHTKTVGTGQNLVPALWRRFVPSAMRLQELLATELGAVSQVLIELPLTTQPRDLVESVVGWLDFSRYLVRVYPTVARFEQNGSGSGICVEYPARSVETEPRSDVADSRTSTICVSSTRDGVDLASELRVAVAQVTRLPVAPAGEETQMPALRVTCERGSAEIRSTSEIAWQLTGQPVQCEQLNAERSEHDIMLDLFCRRVAGGLVPVPDYHDVGHALRMLEVALGGA
ncbi:MAG: Gfo/Idh/MocA family oxidoreductase [Planctomycetota bacterium]|jgi:predicted dehydrogenase